MSNPSPSEFQNVGGPYEHGYQARPQPPPPNPYGAGTPGYPSYVATPPRSTPGSTVALLVVSALCSVALGILPGLPSLILAIAASSANATDPQKCRRLTKIGWIVLAAMVVLAIIAAFAILYWWGREVSRDYG